MASCKTNNKQVIVHSYSSDKIIIKSHSKKQTNMVHIQGSDLSENRHLSSLYMILNLL